MIRLRRVDPSKSREVLDYLQVTCLPHDSPCEYRAGDVWLVAVDEGIPVAFGCVRPTHADPLGWYLARAGVIPARRGKGLQLRLIRARIAAARKAGATYVVTDTTASNIASSNNLIRSGMLTFWPRAPWALPHSIYWRKDLC